MENNKEMEKIEKNGDFRSDNSFLLGYFEEKDGALVRVNFIFLDDNGNKLSSSLQTGIYTGVELRFSSQNESGSAKKVQAEIYIKEKLLVLSSKIK